MNPEAFAEGLAGRYDIEREIGRGGFATVLLARDLRHERPVALKVLHPEIAATLGTERFKQEIRLAARLQHPHILGVLDSGEVNRQLWFTMPFIEGESVRHRLQRERQLPVDAAIRIAREAADALDYAHRHGVIHRDIKPENILLSEGHALVADFGIARALGGGAVTQTGLTMGTPAYMSPEQASDAASVDARTDVYSLGCVLYEMLAGEPPFTGPTTQAILSRALTETARPLRATRSTVTPVLEAACLRAMSRVPADRYSTAAEFGGALAIAAGETRTPVTAPTIAVEPTIASPSTVATTPAPTASSAARLRLTGLPVALAIGLALIVGVGAALWWWRPTAASSGTRRLAVLPFENPGSKEDDYFADGITDEIRGKLAALHGLQVIARASAAQYKNTSKSPKEIGQELGVEYLLTGTVRWEKGNEQQRRVRVSPELVDASSGTTRWQQPFDTDLSDVFEMQAEIASRVAQALNVALGSGAQEHLAERPTVNVAAYDAFLRGEELSQSLAVTDPVPLRRALSLYQEATRLDPAFVQAWAQSARAACQLAFSSSVADWNLCRSAAERAEALAPNRPETRLAAGVYLQTIPKDRDAALEQFTLGLQAQPNHVELLAASALVERSLGRIDAALAHVQQAARLDPRSVNAAASYARTLHDLHRFKEADAEYARALALAPTNLRVAQLRVTNFLSQGDLAGARAVIATSLQYVNAKAVVVRFATFQEMMWVLPDDLRAQVIRLEPADFDNDRGMWALKVGATYSLMGDAAQARSYARIAATEYRETARRFPTDAQHQELAARALVLAGDKADAIAAAERSLALRESTFEPYYRYQVARVYIQAGEYERALDLLEPLTSQAGDITPGWLRIDPVFTPLRGNPRFERLIKSTT
jgi:eukaryotic-like serine/threonine-protein kinase